VRLVGELVIESWCTCIYNQQSTTINNNNHTNTHTHTHHHHHRHHHHHHRHHLNNTQQITHQREKSVRKSGSVGDEGVQFAVVSTIDAELFSHAKAVTHKVSLLSAAVHHSTAGRRLVIPAKAGHKRVRHRSRALYAEECTRQHVAGAIASAHVCVA
jgi:hypothetical protein